MKFPQLDSKDLKGQLTALKKQKLKMKSLKSSRTV